MLQFAYMFFSSGYPIRSSLRLLFCDCFLPAFYFPPYYQGPCLHVLMQFWTSSCTASRRHQQRGQRGGDQRQFPQSVLPGHSPFLCFHHLYRLPHRALEYLSQRHSGSLLFSPVGFLLCKLMLHSPQGK